MRFALSRYRTRGNIERSAAVDREPLRREQEVRMAVPPEPVGFAESVALAAVPHEPQVRTDFFGNAWKVHPHRGALLTASGRVRRMKGTLPVSADRADEALATPLISVCVPMYNNGATIERCLRSILDQDGVDFEILVVDDQSSDDSAATVTKLLRAGDRLIHNESRLGLNGNHNRCLENARGDCVQFVHGDDWLLPGALQTLARCFKDPDVGMAFAPRHVVNQNIPQGSRQQVPDKLHTMFVKLREHNRGPSLVLQVIGLYGASANLIGEPTCVMCRRQLALDAGGLRTDIYQTVDLDLWLRLMLRTVVCFVPEELSVRYHTADTETARIKGAQLNWLDQLRILTWMIVDPASTPLIRISATVWWLPMWLALIGIVSMPGPQRRSRLKTAVQAPVREFARARQFRNELIGTSR